MSEQDSDMRTMLLWDIIPLRVIYDATTLTGWLVVIWHKGGGWMTLVEAVFTWTWVSCKQLVLHMTGVVFGKGCFCCCCFASGHGSANTTRSAVSKFQMEGSKSQNCVFQNLDSVSFWITLKKKKSDWKFSHTVQEKRGKQYVCHTTTIQQICGLCSLHPPALI